MFYTGEDRQCHRVQIVNDNTCDPGDFLSNLFASASASNVTVDPDTARVVITDTDDCSEWDTYRDGTLPSLHCIRSVLCYPTVGVMVYSVCDGV